MQLKTRRVGKQVDSLEQFRINPAGINDMTIIAEVHTANGIPAKKKEKEVIFFLQNFLKNIHFAFKFLFWFFQAENFVQPSTEEGASLQEKISMPRLYPKKLT